MTAYMYILRCSDGSFYVGSTRDIHHRFDQHAAGRGAVYTRRRRPVELVFTEECENVGEAFALEKQVQGWSRAKRQALIDGEFHLLPGLARKKWQNK